MAQWFFWLVATTALYEPWGMVLGGLIVAAQIAALFGRKPVPEC